MTTVGEIKFKNNFKLSQVCNLPNDTQLEFFGFGVEKDSRWYRISNTHDMLVIRKNFNTGNEEANVYVGSFDTQMYRKLCYIKAAKHHVPEEVALALGLEEEPYVALTTALYDKRSIEVEEKYRKMLHSSIDYERCDAIEHILGSECYSSLKINAGMGLARPIANFLADLFDF